MGVHISFARSLDLDSWSETQLKFMYDGGGNEKFRSFMNADGGGGGENVIFTRDGIRAVYDSEAARWYRTLLKARVEGKPEPTMADLKSTTNKNNYSTTDTATTTTTNQSNNNKSGNKPTLSSHLLKSKLPSPKQRFIAGMKYYTYKYLTIPTKTNYKTSLSLCALYTINSLTLLPSKTSSFLNTIFRSISLSYLSSLFLLSLCSIHWFNKHRQESFKSCTNFFLSRQNEGRIKRNPLYDIYFPTNVTIGSIIPKAMIFYPESLVDITSYAKIMSKLSDAGILVIVVNFNPTWMVSPFHHRIFGTLLNDCFQIVYQIEKLMGMTVKEWVLGGHGDGVNVVLDLRSKIYKEKTKTMTNKGKEMRCVLWGMNAGPTTNPTTCIAKTEKDILCITASNDYIAGPLRLEQNISKTLLHGTNVQYFNIDGGNHSAFGHYGPQTFPRRDGECTKSIDLQQKDCVMRTLDFILEREPAVNKKD